MTTTSLIELAAWVLSAVIAIWMLFDLVKVGRSYDEEFLTSTIEDLGEPDLGDER